MHRVVLFVALLGLALPSTSLAGTVTVGHGMSIVPRTLCFKPKMWEKVCTKYGPAPAGKLFGPCLKYQLECVSPPKIQ